MTNLFLPSLYYYLQNCYTNSDILLKTDAFFINNYNFSLMMINLCNLFNKIVTEIQ